MCVFFCLYFSKYINITDCRVIERATQNDGQEYDYAVLAASTLLLALLKQRMNDIKGTRAVFVNFFRTISKNATITTTTSSSYDTDKQHVHQQQQPQKDPTTTSTTVLLQCPCSAKVMQAYALFEMKRGNTIKSLYLVQMAVQMDPNLAPVLLWKQFRDVLDKRKRKRTERINDSIVSVRGGA